jgi:hypothetical protein
VKSQQVEIDFRIPASYIRWIHGVIVTRKLHGRNQVIRSGSSTDISMKVGAGRPSMSHRYTITISVNSPNYLTEQGLSALVESIVGMGYHAASDPERQTYYATACDIADLSFDEIEVKYDEKAE